MEVYDCFVILCWNIFCVEFAEVLFMLLYMDYELIHETSLFVLSKHNFHIDTYALSLLYFFVPCSVIIPES